MPSTDLPLPLPDSYSAHQSSNLQTQELLKDAGLYLYLAQLIDKSHDVEKSSNFSEFSRKLRSQWTDPWLARMEGSPSMHRWLTNFTQLVEELVIKEIKSDGLEALSKELVNSFPEAISYASLLLSDKGLKSAPISSIRVPVLFATNSSSSKPENRVAHLELLFVPNRMSGGIHVHPADRWRVNDMNSLPADATFTNALKNAYSILEAKQTIGGLPSGSILWRLMTFGHDTPYRTGEYITGGSIGGAALRGMYHLFCPSMNYNESRDQDIFIIATLPEIASPAAVTINRNMDLLPVDSTSLRAKISCAYTALAGYDKEHSHAKYALFVTANTAVSINGTGVKSEQVKWGFTQVDELFKLRNELVAGKRNQSYLKFTVYALLLLVVSLSLYNKHDAEIKKHNAEIASWRERERTWIEEKKTYENEKIVAAADDYLNRSQSLQRDKPQSLDDSLNDTARQNGITKEVLLATVPRTKNKLAEKRNLIDKELLSAGDYVRLLLREKIDVLQIEAKVYLVSGEIENAMAFLNQALTISIEINDVKLKADIEIDLAKILVSQARTSPSANKAEVLTKARVLAEHAINYYRDEQLNEERAISELILGQIFTDLYVARNESSELSYFSLAEGAYLNAIKALEANDSSYRPTALGSLLALYYYAYPYVDGPTKRKLSDDSIQYYKSMGNSNRDTWQGFTEAIVELNMASIKILYANYLLEETASPLLDRVEIINDISTHFDNIYKRYEGDPNVMEDPRFVVTSVEYNVLKLRMAESPDAKFTALIRSDKWNAKLISDETKSSNPYFYALGHIKNAEIWLLHIPLMTDSSAEQRQEARSFAISSFSEALQYPGLKIRERVSLMKQRADVALDYALHSTGDYDARGVHFRAAHDYYEDISKLKVGTISKVESVDISFSMGIIFRRVMYSNMDTASILKLKDYASLSGYNESVAFSLGSSNNCFIKCEDFYTRGQYPGKWILIQKYIAENLSVIGNIHRAAGKRDYETVFKQARDRAKAGLQAAKDTKDLNMVRELTILINGIGRLE